MMLQKNIRFVALGVVFCVVAFWGGTKISKPLLKKVFTYILEDKNTEDRRKNRTVSVEVEAVKLGTVTKRISSVGRLKANSQVTLRSEIHGKVKEVLFVEGGDVEEGQEILRFENADMAAELKKAEAEAELYKGEYDRVLKLYQSKVGSEKEFQKMKAQYESAKSQVDLAKSRLEKTILRAPFAGTIGLIDATTGTYFQTGQEIVTVVNNNPMKVLFKVPEKHVRDIGVGQSVEIKVDAFPDQVFFGTVEAVEPRVNAESYSIEMRASIPNEDGLLFSGLFANVSLVIGEENQAITVPDASVDREGEIQYVWVIEKGRAYRRRILVGSREKGKVEVVAGLKPGQLIVTTGQIKLVDGMRVKIENMPIANITSADIPAAQAQQNQPKATSETEETSPNEKTQTEE